MALQVLNTDNEFTKELKEAVIKVFVAAGVQETGFNKEGMVKYLLGLMQAGKMPDAPPWPSNDHFRIAEITSDICGSVDEMFSNGDNNYDGIVNTGEAFDFILEKVLQANGVNSSADLVDQKKMYALHAIRMYSDMMSGAAAASGEDKLNQVKDKLKKAFDKCDVNGDGVLDREEMKSGCLVIAKSIAEMCPGMPGGEDSELQDALDGFIAESCPDGGKISFDAMLAVALSNLCDCDPGEDPVEFFAKIDLCMFITINMQIDMYLGGLLK